MEKLKWVFSQQNLKQYDTMKAVAGFVTVVILLFYPPKNPLNDGQMADLTNQIQLVIGLTFAAIGGLCKILASYHGVVATINLLHKEDKPAIVPPATIAKE